MKNNVANIVWVKRSVTILIAGIVLSGCKSPDTKKDSRDGYFVSHAFKSVGVNERVQYLIVHYTALDDTMSLKVLTENEVSSHYLIPSTPEQWREKPVVIQLVDENKRAWHAGESSWRGRSNLNDTSVGIEIVNPGFTDNLQGERTWYPYNEKQITAFAALAKDIIKRYRIAPSNVLGHSDIAPLRKLDPGRLFPWERLASMGVGAWPDKLTVNKYLAGRGIYSPVDVMSVQKLLKAYGYDKIPQHGALDEETRNTISAFQMHFRPHNIDGNPDAETEAIASALVVKYMSTSEVKM